ncbi:YihY/virulence factor BrkB family protein [Paenibacillus sp. IB182496]|uniref:YihY/virulence factor BrkB family protein n=1 Tax=Paenibacillus sabuli TaxID=2772509 RepID=A0A927BSC9_9BACL|nr:YihY/virulence factor BrkB family protein [Paenibacillus sabuli]MBD2844654.1 YihY/virulence factor BrkB family protein [Paenibacillus sabuli]
MTKSRVSFGDFVQELYSRFQDDEVPALGAQLTYYLILAFFPFLIFLVTVIGYTQVSEQEVIDAIASFMPADSATMVTTILDEVRENGSGTLLSVGMLATFWAASNGINAIIKGLNKAYDEEENRPFWKVRGISLLSTVVLALIIITSMLMLIFGQVIGEQVFRLLNYPSGFDPVWTIAQYIIPLLIMVGVFMLLYKITPNRFLTFRDVLPGSLFATLGWIVTSLAFSFYVSQFGNYSKTYGSIGGIIVLLIWLYLSSIIILLGGEINAALAFIREGKRKQSSKAFALDLPFFRKNKPVE